MDNTQLIDLFDFLEPESRAIVETINNNLPFTDPDNDLTSSDAITSTNLVQNFDCSANSDEDINNYIAQWQPDLLENYFVPVEISSELYKQLSYLQRTGPCSRTELITNTCDVNALVAQAANRGKKKTAPVIVGERMAAGFNNYMQTKLRFEKRFNITTKPLLFQIGKGRGAKVATDLSYYQIQSLAVIPADATERRHVCKVEPRDIDETYNNIVKPQERLQELCIRLLQSVDNRLMTAAQIFHLTRLAKSDNFRHCDFAKLKDFKIALETICTTVYVDRNCVYYHLPDEPFRLDFSPPSVARKVNESYFTRAVYSHVQLEFMKAALPKPVSRDTLHKKRKQQDTASEELSECESSISFEADDDMIHVPALQFYTIAERELAPYEELSSVNGEEITLVKPNWILSFLSRSEGNILIRKDLNEGVHLELLEHSPLEKLQRVADPYAPLFIRRIFDKEQNTERTFFQTTRLLVPNERLYYTDTFEQQSKRQCQDIGEIQLYLNSLPPPIADTDDPVYPCLDLPIATRVAIYDSVFN